MTATRIEVVTADVIASDPCVLSPEEHQRWSGLRRLDDRDRYFSGVMLRRLRLREAAGREDGASVAWSFARPL